MSNQTADKQKLGLDCAFPNQRHDGQGMPCAEASEGLTKREYFAALAMQGIKANSIPGSHHQPRECVREAVELADLLLLELSK